MLTIQPYHPSFQRPHTFMIIYQLLVCIRELVVVSIAIALFDKRDLHFAHRTQPAYEDQDMNAVPPACNDASGARR